MRHPFSHPSTTPRPTARSVNPTLLSHSAYTSGHTKQLVRAECARKLRGSKPEIESFACRSPPATVSPPPPPAAYTPIISWTRPTCISAGSALWCGKVPRYLGGEQSGCKCAVGVPVYFAWAIRASQYLAGRGAGWSGSVCLMLRHLAACSCGWVVPASVPAVSEILLNRSGDRVNNC